MSNVVAVFSPKIAKDVFLENVLNGAGREVLKAIGLKNASQFSVDLC